MCLLLVKSTGQVTRKRSGYSPRSSDSAMQSEARLSQEEGARGAGGTPSWWPGPVLPGAQRDGQRGPLFAPWGGGWMGPSRSQRVGFRWRAPARASLPAHTCRAPAWCRSRPSQTGFWPCVQFPVGSLSPAPALAPSAARVRKGPPQGRVALALCGACESFCLSSCSSPQETPDLAPSREAASRLGSAQDVSHLLMDVTSKPDSSQRVAPLAKIFKWRLHLPEFTGASAPHPARIRPRGSAAPSCSRPRRPDVRSRGRAPGCRGDRESNGWPPTSGFGARTARFSGRPWASPREDGSWLRLSHGLWQTARCVLCPEGQGLSAWALGSPARKANSRLRPAARWTRGLSAAWTSQVCSSLRRYNEHQTLPRVRSAEGLRSVSCSE